MNILTLRNTYSKCAFSVLPFYMDTQLGAATGFLYEHENRTFVVTNWHVVTGRDPRDRSIIHENRRLSACPTKLGCRIIERVQDTENGLAVTRVQGHFIELFSDGMPMWYEHPEYGHRCDVVAIPIDADAAMLTRAVHLAVNRVDEGRIPLMPGETVFILGYPIGIGSAGGFPIWKSGYVASEPELPVSIPFKAGTDETTIDKRWVPAFYIDSSTRQGMSGAPVIAKYTGMWDPGDPYGSDDLLSDDHVIGSAAEFLGCYSGRVLSSELEAGLGICWRKSAIEEICAARVHGSNPHIQ